MLLNCRKKNKKKTLGTFKKLVCYVSSSVAALLVGREDRDGRRRIYNAGPTNGTSATGTSQEPLLVLPKKKSTI
jgi:hypothetical protein